MKPRDRLSGADDLEFSGERVVPGKVERDLLDDHVSRYSFGARYVADKDVLDFGCGAGYGVEILRSAGARRVVGIDNASDAINYAGSRYAAEGVSFVVGDCEHSGFRSASFDVVVCLEVLEHLDRWLESLQEVRRLLRDDGVFIVSTPNRAIYARERQGVPNPFHVHEFDEHELASALRQQFSHVEIFGESRVQCVSFLGIGANRASTASVSFSDDDIWTDPSYLLAVCSMNGKDDRESSMPHFHTTAATTVTVWKAIEGITQQLDERTKWIQTVSDELMHQSEVIIRHEEAIQNQASRTAWLVRVVAVARWIRRRLPSHAK
jgi:SAM-dependent methyltransferase